MKRTKNDNAYFVWSGLILFCIVIAVFTLAFASCTSGGEKKPAKTAPPVTNSASPETGTPDNTDNPDVSPPDTGTQAQPPGTEVTELAETADMGQEYIDKIVFLGDSTTNGLAHYNVVPRSQVWTPSSGTLTISRWDIDKITYPDDETQLFITEAVAKKKPEYLLMTLGVNGVSFLDEEGFTLCYEALIDGVKAASPDTKIILNTIYPVALGYNPNSGITNEKIDAANGWIKKIAESKGVKFLNSASILKDGTGAMTAGYDNGDFIHPNAETYGLIINYIRTHGYQ